MNQKARKRKTCKKQARTGQSAKVTMVTVAPLDFCHSNVTVTHSYRWQIWLSSYSHETEIGLYLEPCV